MKGVIFKEGFAFVYLSKSFYLKNAIFESLNVYNEFLDYLYMDDENYHILKVLSKNEDYELNHLSNEFLNYLIGEEQKVLAK